MTEISRLNPFRFISCFRLVEVRPDQSESFEDKEAGLQPGISRCLVLLSYVGKSLVQIKTGMKLRSVQNLQRAVLLLEDDALSCFKMQILHRFSDQHMRNRRRNFICLCILLHMFASPVFLNAILE